MLSNAAYTWCSRSFAAAAPALWNKLPADIRNVASSNSLILRNQSIPFFLTNHFNFLIYYYLLVYTTPVNSAVGNE